MARTPFADTALPGAVSDAIRLLGANLRRARLRRRMTVAELATRAQISRPTVQKLEVGHPGTAIAHYAAVLWVLGLDAPLRELAAPDRDEVGLALEAARTPSSVRARRELSDDF